MIDRPSHTSTLIPRIFVFILLALTYPLANAADSAVLPTHQAIPGGVAVLKLPVATSNQAVFYNNKRVLIKDEGQTRYAIVGIPLTAKTGKHQLRISHEQGKTTIIPFTVTAKNYATQHIKLQNKRMVNPSAEDLVRIRQEQQISQQAFNLFSDNTEVTTRFIYPVSGRLSSPFGLRRFFNGEEKRPHSGLDIAAPEDTPIIAPAAGTVVAVGEFFYNGNTVFIDHGQGLVTMYCHMNRIDVRQGQKIRQGEILGVVGMTGRATGPHLHFSVSLNDVRVEPLLFLPDNPPSESNQQPDILPTPDNK